MGWDFANVWYMQANGYPHLIFEGFIGVAGITAVAGYGGAVTGVGLVYTVTPNSGYVIDQVFVDGVEQPVTDRSGLTHTFVYDQGQHSIFATFGYIVNFNLPANGSLTVSSAGISLSSGTLVRGGQALDITATPGSGYVLTSLTINGVDVTAAYSGGYAYTVGAAGFGATRMLAGGPEVMDQGANIVATFGEPPPVPTLSVGPQNGTLTAGAGGAVTYPVTTANIASGSPITLNAAPPGVTLGTAVTAGDSTTLAINAAATVAAGVYPLTLTIDGVTSDPFNLTVLPAPAVKTLLVGAQSAALTEGAGGAVTYPVTTANIASGSPITLDGAPPGVTLVTAVTAGSSTTLTIDVAATVAAGVYPLTLTIDGVKSNGFSLIVLSNSPASATPIPALGDAALALLALLLAGGAALRPGRLHNDQPKGKPAWPKPSKT